MEKWEGAETGLSSLTYYQWRMILTRRQAEVAALVVKGWSNAEIATALGLQRSTVKCHLAAIYQRRGVRNRTELALALAAPSGRLASRRSASGSRAEPSSGGL